MITASVGDVAATHLLLVSKVDSGVQSWNDLFLPQVTGDSCVPGRG